jgi:signal transduction histidine kinase
MTRQIALAILATVWLSLILGGLSIYWTTRAILLTELDATLLKRALSLPEVTGGRGGPVYLPRDDRYVIRNDYGQTVARAASIDQGVVHPEIVHASFAELAGGPRVRSITVRTADSGGSQARPLTIVYSGSAEGFDRVLNRLAIALTVFGAIGGMAGALVAMRVARSAIRPLLGAANEIGEIDESRLDRRIEASALPVELRPVAQRLNDMLSRLEVAFNRRKQFLADTSHELRTPIAALLTTLEVAARRPRSAGELQQTLQRCLVDVRLLHRLASALLEQARGEQAAAGGGAMETTVDVVRLLHECVEAVMPLAEQKGVSIVRDELPAEMLLHTQEDRLRSILINLLSNAIEYNRPAGGMVRVKLWARGDEALMAVEDTGIGLSPEDVEQVFEPFFRASKSRGGGGGHLGLGLYLVKTHAAALGGRCRVESELGEGSRFILSIPNAIVKDSRLLSGGSVPVLSSTTAAAGEESQ